MADLDDHPGESGLGPAPGGRTDGGDPLASFPRVVDDQSARNTGPLCVVDRLLGGQVAPSEVVACAAFLTSRVGSPPTTGTDQRAHVMPDDEACGHW